MATLLPQLPVSWCFLYAKELRHQDWKEGVSDEDDDADDGLSLRCLDQRGVAKFGLPTGSMDQSYT